VDGQRSIIGSRAGQALAGVIREVLPFLVVPT
jgi:hypothetical protein